MDSPCGMSDEQRRISKFTDGLAEEIEKEIRKKTARVSVDTSALDRNSGFIISIYVGNHYHEIMVSESRKKPENVVVDRFTGIYPVTRYNRKISSTPQQLRATADTYDDVTKFLNEKFGTPFEHDGRAIYHASLQQEAELPKP